MIKIATFVAQVLLQHGAKVYLAARSKSKAEEAIRDLKAATGKQPLFLELDLSNLASIRKSAQEFLENEQELHILFNNASVLLPSLSSHTDFVVSLQRSDDASHW